MPNRNTTFSVDLDPDQVSRLGDLARSRQCSTSQLLQQAIDAFLEVQTWQIEHIRQGLDELRDGKGIPHDAVDQWLASWGSSSEGEPPL
jgi:predicted transcriptional regulator